MRPIRRYWFPALVVALFLGGLSWNRPPLQAQSPPGPQTIVLTRPRLRHPEPPPLDPFLTRGPRTEVAARTWLKLNMKCSLPFEADTPLEEVIQHIQTITADKESFPNGIPFYLDEVGMNEANSATPTSSVKISLEGAPLKVGLRLLLKQIGLIFGVTDEGVIIITSPAQKADLALDCNPEILIDEVRELRLEVDTLRQEVDILRGNRRPQGSFR